MAVAAGEPALLLIDVYPREGLEAEIVRIAIAPPGPPPGERTCGVA